MNNICRKFLFVLVALMLLVLPTSCKKGKKVIFETNGGNTIEAATVQKKAEYTLPTEVTKEGYEFAGWYLTSDCTGEPVSSVTMGKKDITVYAAWKALVKVTLNADGGNLSQTVVYGKSGDSILSLVQGITPTKGNLKFGGWFNGTTEVTANTKLSQKDITLTAKYQAAIEVNVYKQNIAKDGYDKETKTVYEYVGKTYTPAEDVEGFTYAELADTIDEITVSDDASKNVINLYYNRDTYTVTLRSNFPDESREKSMNVTVVYGEEKELPETNFTCDGYYLLGFATSANGPIVYDAHFIENAVINGEKAEGAKAILNVTRNTSLYAIWNKGNVDMFGGSDFIFTSGEKTAYLCRGGVYFVGEYYEDGSFLFENKQGNIEGRIFADGTFAYYNGDREGKSATLYEVGKGLNEKEKIIFDAYNGITYSKEVEAGRTEISKGSYTIDEFGYYEITYTEGELADSTMVIIVGTVTLNGVKTEAYQLRKNNEYEYGQLVRFAIYNGNLTYYTSAYDIVLTGFGVLRYNTGNGYTTYYYTYNEATQVLNITSSSGQSVGIAKIFEVEGKKGYMFFDEAQALTYTAENGDTLALDGMVNATLTTQDGTVNGYYETAASAFGTLVKFHANGQTTTYLATSKTVEVTIGDDTKKETTYSFTKKLNTYAEYYYKDAEGIYYAPLIVIDDETEGVASIYGYTKTKSFELVATGAYSYDEISGKYVLTVDEYFEKDVLTSPVSYENLQKIIFVVDTKATNYAINYWYAVTILDTETTFDVTYIGNGENASLVLVQGMAIYSKDGYTVIGTYTTKGEITTITTPQGNVYVELDNDTHTFISLEHAPFNAYIVSNEGTYNQSTYLEFNGKGGAIYHYTEQEEVDGEMKNVAKSFEGTVKATDDTTKQGAIIYTFTSAEKTFSYIRITMSNAVFVLPSYGEFGGTYTSEDGILTLDGFGYYATFVNSDGETIEGIYAKLDENVIRITSEFGYYYFDMKDQSFSVRGTEYGTYLFMNNQGMPGYYLLLDGYGKLTVYTYVEGERTTLDDNGTYTIDGATVTLKFKDGAESFTFEGEFSTYTYDSTVFNTFVVYHKEVVKTFVNEKDWSILVLDSLGNAVKTDSKGIQERGTYIIVTSTLLYYVNEASTDANIYTYDLAKGTIKPANFTARGFYTEDLKSLLFSKYGFAIFNNETRYYYTMQGDDVIIYRHDAENKDANEYGFVEENFGSFSEVKEYKGETYYQTDGYAISFKRKEETKDDYLVLVTSNPEVYAPLEELVFTPSGSDTFNVSGSVTINGTPYQCTVVRELVDDEYVMYITIGYHRFDINAKFYGTNVDGSSTSTYEVLNHTLEVAYYPYKYLDTYYMLYSFLGPQYAASYKNTIGMVYMNVVYDKDGQTVSDKMTIELGESSGCYDTNGNLLVFEDCDYTFANGIYELTTLGTDGYTYNFRFSLQRHNAFNMSAYRVYACSRVENITYGDYTIMAERIIQTDTNYAPGTFYTIELHKGQEELKYSEFYAIGDDYYYIVRTIDDDTKKVTSTTYYKMTFVEQQLGPVEEGEFVVTVVPYDTIMVEEIPAETVYADNGITYLDILGGKITFINLDGTKYSVQVSEYDELTETYTITAANGKKYTVQIIEGVAKIKDYKEEGDN